MIMMMVMMMMMVVLRGIVGFSGGLEGISEHPGGAEGLWGPSFSLLMTLFLSAL